MKALPEKFTTWPQHLTFAQSELTEHTFHHVVVKGEHWLWAADVENSADFVYAGSDRRSEAGRGMGGAACTFKLVDGGVVVLYGPFKCAPSYLKAAAGIDLSSRHYTRGVIAFAYAMSKEGGSYFQRKDFTDLLHLDEDWTLGTFDRIEELAQEIANREGRKVYYHSQSSGGSTAAWQHPEEGEA